MAMSLCSKRIFLGKNLSILNSRYYGYVVLIPEIGEDSPTKSSLLQQDGLPEFNNITIENCTATIAKQTLEFEDGVKSIENDLQKQDINTFKDIFTPLDVLSSSLELTWGLSKTLYLGNNTLMPTKTYLAIHDRAKRARAAKYNSNIIYEKVKSELLTNAEMPSEERRLLQKFALEGKLNGLELDSSRKMHLKETLNKLAEERNKFKQKVDFQTQKFSHTVSDHFIVRDFPENLLKLTATDSRYFMNGPWKITLQPNIYLPVMQFCPDREIRWNIWQALVSRGSGYADREMATGSHLEEIRYVRHNMAKLLGYETFAHMSMETKMAGSIENVKDMIKNLLEEANPAQVKELDDLYNFATKRGFKGDRIELWDVPYWRKKQEQSLFNYNEQEFKEFFPFKKVLKGLFALCEKLFNIIIKQRNDSSTWHKDVKFYDIFEPHTSAPVAGFYLDPYTRNENKLNNPNHNGWMVAIQNKSRVCDKIPIASLIFNFELPVGEKSSYLSFKEVSNLFHKFGHALQHLLTKTNYSEVSGLSNVEWDAVEICGYVLSHWLYNKTVIDSISSHHNSGDVLPTDKFNCLCEMRKHLAGLDLSRELYLSALDLELYSTRNYWLNVQKELWPVYRDFPLDKMDSHPCSFTQIFTEEWAAAYYSHIWSRVIAADVYSAFHEVQDDEEQVVKVGNRYRNTFLALGGSAHPSKIFREFRGRDPSPQALLSYLGLRQIKT